MCLTSSTSSMPTNSDRAEWAALAVDRYSRATRIMDEEDFIRIQDLLSSLQHLAHQNNLDWGSIVSAANRDFETQLCEDEE